MSEPIISGHNDETTYSVCPTGLNAEGKPYSMAPVCFVARCRTWGLQDYFTPDEARTLAAALIACANEVEAKTEPQRCSHGHTADEECAGCVDDEMADEVALA